LSRENVEIVRSLQPSSIDLVEMFAAGDSPRLPFPEEYAARFVTDFRAEFISNASGAEGPEWHGLQGFVQGWRDWLEPWASYRITAEEFIDAGDEVVVFARVEARTARDAVAVEHEPAAVWTLEEGKVVGIRMYLERARALEDAGLMRQDAARNAGA
jgi:ketosteroid isomerase-like protein